ncbi:bifunctional allantoicase/(S)-ureidoglycine aminohydrolase [uncultured Litoreibacter sp.]|uniref:bifunctional allantoicase/(S)-ureidoglycine aminohydrolase n=1 Tax=uncultured Litoreibacter sp. TaxID=1392394 RepID=UPI002616718C|nr:bifunctional allantoicase/(S)-ureidoglycine aminohydrolase [uncultured Litoreibacter sp.]
MTYALPPAGLPSQSDTLTGTSIFTEAYAFMPAGVMRDIVTSALPHWTNSRAWIIARPLSGFAETFSQYIMEVSAGGGSDRPEDNTNAEAVLFVVEGTLVLRNSMGTHTLTEGGYAYLPAGEGWTLHNTSAAKATFHWVRKRYEPVDGIPRPEAFVTNDKDHAPISMPDTDGKWATTRFVEPTDLRHDMHVNIVTFQPGGLIPFEETHVMEHGLYVIEGTAEYLLNRDWVSVGPGDFMWLRAFCPQACRATGDGPFRYLLYKDVNRHAKLPW